MFVEGGEGGGALEGNSLGFRSRSTSEGTFAINNEIFCVHVFNMDRYMHANVFHVLITMLIDKEMNKETDESEKVSVLGGLGHLLISYILQMYVVYINRTEFVYLRMCL